MNKKQRKIIVDAYMNNLDFGYNNDPRSAYNEICNFFLKLFETDANLENMADEALLEWENNGR